MTGPPPYQPALAVAFAEVADPLQQPVVLVGHSGAGPLLPERRLRDEFTAELARLPLVHGLVVDLLASR